MRQVIDNLLVLSIDDLCCFRRCRRLKRAETRSICPGSLWASWLNCAKHPQREVKVVIERDVRVDADASLLRIVLENLLGNAWKFTGEVEHARIEFGAFDRDGSKVFFVRDTERAST